jgi:hypothetical protein
MNLRQAIWRLCNSYLRDVRRASTAAVMAVKTTLKEDHSGPRPLESGSKAGSALSEQWAHGHPGRKLAECACETCADCPDCPEPCEECACG